MIIRPIIFLIFCLNIYTSLLAQSLIGVSGLLNTPSADFLINDEISFGVSYFESKYLPITFQNEDALAYYASINYLPFLELGLRFTRRIAIDDALGDRMFIFRIKLIDENINIPSIVIGIHDPFHSTEAITNRFTATYIVATKNYLLKSFVNKVKFSLGYGANILLSRSHQFVGAFGGMSFELLKFLELIGEYDSKYFNSGIKLNLFNHITLSAAYMNLNYFCFGANYRFRLE